MNYSTMQDQVEDQVALISQLFPCLFTTMPPEQVEEQRPKRRRRRKSKREGSGLGAKKRKLSTEQTNRLEMNFGCEQKLECERKDRIASDLGLDPRQVSVWFQNRRTRLKKEQLEDGFSKLRNLNDTLVVQKSHLETEVLSLADQLKDAKEEIQRLLTMDHHANYVINPQLFGDQFGLEDCFESMFHFPSGDFGAGIDWVNLYDM